MDGELKRAARIAATAPKSIFVPAGNGTAA